MRVHGGVAVIIPTVAGREADLGRTTVAYETEPGVRVFPQYDHSTVGAGWTAGVERILAGQRWPDDEDRAGPDDWQPEFVMCGNDDMWPSLGWLAPAIETIDAGQTPCPVMWNSRGDLESAGAWQVLKPDGSEVPWTPLCFFRLDEWQHFGPIPPWHYYSDNYFATASIHLLHRPIVVRHAFRFTHTWAQPGRKDMSSAEGREHGRLYKQFRDTCERNARPR